MDFLVTLNLHEAGARNRALESDGRMRFPGFFSHSRPHKAAFRVRSVRILYTII